MRPDRPACATRAGRVDAEVRVVDRQHPADRLDAAVLCPTRGLGDHAQGRHAASVTRRNTLAVGERAQRRYVRRRADRLPRHLRASPPSARRTGCRENPRAARRRGTDRRRSRSAAASCTGRSAGRRRRCSCRRPRGTRRRRDARARRSAAAPASCRAARGRRTRGRSAPRPDTRAGARGRARGRLRARTAAPDSGPRRRTASRDSSSGCRAFSTLP